MQRLQEPSCILALSRVQGLPSGRGRRGDPADFHLQPQGPGAGAGPAQARKRPKAPPPLIFLFRLRPGREPGVRGQGRVW